MKAIHFYVYEFTTTGTGDFPFDMLRYDRCCPVDDDSARKLSDANCYSSAVLVVEHYSIRLRTYQQVKGGPTIGRWESFGWDVSCVEEVSG